MPFLKTWKVDFTSAAVLGVLLALVCVALQYSPFLLGMSISERPRFHDVSGEDNIWSSKLMPTSEGVYAFGIAPVFGRCTLKDSRGYELDSSASRDLKTRTKLFLYYEFVARTSEQIPITIECEELTKFGIAHNLRRASWGSTNAVKATLVLQFLIEVLLGPVFSIFLLFSILIHKRGIGNEREALRYHVLFALIAFCYMLTLAHWPMLFVKLEQLTFWQTELRVLFSWTFVLLLGTYSVQSKFQNLLHIAILVIAGARAFAGIEYFNQLFQIVLWLLTALTFWAAYSLWRSDKIIDPNSRMLLRALTVCWCLLQVAGNFGSYLNYSQLVSPAFVMIFSIGIVWLRFSERKALDLERIELRERLLVHEERSKLAAQFAHDIKSPLMALSVAISSDSLASNESSVLIKGAIQRISGISEDLIRDHRASKSTQEERKETVALTRIAEIVSTIVAEKLAVLPEKRIRIELNLRIDSDKKAVLDVLILQRILSNILNNAIEAVANANVPLISVSSEVLGNRINIIVRDCGPGFPASVLKNLGKYGNTLGKHRGSGLGIAHAIENVKSWGGDVSFENLSDGAKVVISVPILE